MIALSILYPKDILQCTVKFISIRIIQTNKRRYYKYLSQDNFLEPSLFLRVIKENLIINLWNSQHCFLLKEMISYLYYKILEMIMNNFAR
jgi:hypothetical protein